MEMEVGKLYRVAALRGDKVTAPEDCLFYEEKDVDVEAGFVGSEELWLEQGELHLRVGDIVLFLGDFKHRLPHCRGFIYPTILFGEKIWSSNVTASECYKYYAFERVD